MELWLTLRFRGAPLGLRDRFPPELAFLARQLRSLDGPEVPPHERISTAYVELSPEQAEAVVAWGRMRGIDGRTLLASATYEERWRAHELAGVAAVELGRAPAVGPPLVLGRSRSHLARWACSHCDRIRWEQVGPLELALDEPADVELLHRARPELLLTEVGELVVSSRLRPVLEAHGLATRPVLGTRSWVQVEVQATARLASVPPLEGVGRPCRGCAERRLRRSEGPEAPNDVRIVRTVSWSLVDPLPPEVSLAWSEQRVGFAGAVQEGPVHPMGAPIDLELHPGLVAEQGGPVLLASAQLACALADAHAGGLDIRPVRCLAAGRREIAPHAASC
jgi:hypothetical protein